ncbi:MAG: prolipoprotein diacylglyceryl transferase [Candidatus Hydrogenedentes bacterium]|nr:prolipoprotein diacylglyceryl transferase [Candidatus Hydrogenedentota bacterium]
MRPELFHIGGVSFGAYRTLLTVAFITGTLLTVREAGRRGDCGALSPMAGGWGFLGAILGAKAFYIVQYDSPWHVWRAFLLWGGGLVYYGGLAGGVAAVAVYLRIRRIPLVKALDIMAVYLPLGQAITRVGCFLNGCCYGTESSLPWAVRFPPGSVAFAKHVNAGLVDPAAGHSLTVHPAQLYMVAGLLIVFAVAKVVLHRKQHDGAVLFTYLLLYGVLRFFVEFVRGDNARSVAHLTVYQVISLGLIVGGGAALLWLRRRPPREA